MRIVLVAVMLLSGAQVGADAGRQGARPGVPAAAVTEIFAHLCSGGCSNEERARWRENLKHEWHDLNDDGVPELFLYVEHHEWCGAGFNCQYWIFQKRWKGYTLLLNDPVLVVKETITKGYRDVERQGRMGHCRDGRRHLYVTLYKYDGDQYRKHREGEECREPRLSAGR